MYQLDESVPESRYLPNSDTGLIQARRDLSRAQIDQRLWFLCFDKFSLHLSDEVRAKCQFRYQLWLVRTMQSVFI